MQRPPWLVVVLLVVALVSTVGWALSARRQAPAGQATAAAAVQGGANAGHDPAGHSTAAPPRTPRRWRRATASWP